MVVEKLLAGISLVCCLNAHNAIANVQPLETETVTASEYGEAYDERYYDNLEALALITMAEAEGESELGKRLVIDTVLNRVDSDEFPDDISDVIYQDGQFTSISNGRYYKVELTDEVCRLVLEEIEHRYNSQVLYFTAGGYGKFGTPAFKEGNHYFCY